MLTDERLAVVEDHFNNYAAWDKKLLGDDGLALVAEVRSLRAALADLVSCVSTGATWDLADRAVPNALASARAVLNPVSGEEGDRP